MNFYNLKKTILILIILSTILFSSFADGYNDVLATNSWTAAFVEMAGGRAGQLAPVNMEHPPEYELRPSDIRKIRAADLLVFAGYEVLMETVFDSFSKPEEQMVQIITSYAPPMLEKSVLAIADKLGTTTQAERNIAAYKGEIAAARERLKDAGLFGVPVLVQFHQKPLALALGFEILGEFGPQPLEVRQIAELGKMNPILIIDNAHNPMASPLTEILDVDVVELVNFPGYPNEDGTYTPGSLTGMLNRNVEEILEK